MRISGGVSPTYQTQVNQMRVSQNETQHKVRVLKQALESQKSSAEQLLNMLDPRGQNLDIKA